MFALLRSLTTELTHDPPTFGEGEGLAPPPLPSPSPLNCQWLRALDQQHQPLSYELMTAVSGDEQSLLHPHMKHHLFRWRVSVLRDVATDS